MKKSLIENFIFCAVKLLQDSIFLQKKRTNSPIGFFLQSYKPFMV